MSLHDDPDGGDEARLLFLIQAPTLVRCVYQRKGPGRGFGDLEANTLQVLIAVALFPDRTVGELAQRLALAQSTTSTAVGRLQKRGLVRTTDGLGVAQPRPQRVTRSGRALIGRFVRELDSRLGPAGSMGWGCGQDQ
ncbi:MAG TPA: helix-turn-helix domain-containing protein [Solirubrobacteraceae bacterium]|nr:helix-turn-helix domain-containing protein [Solirubrobacteraceae bacterium]